MLTRKRLVVPSDNVGIVADAATEPIDSDVAIDQIASLIIGDGFCALVVMYFLSCCQFNFIVSVPPV